MKTDKTTTVSKEWADMAFTAVKFFRNINYKLLKEQKKTLVKLDGENPASVKLTKKDIKNLGNILGLIDTIQEIAVDDLKIVSDRTAHFYPKK